MDKKLEEYNKYYEIAKRAFEYAQNDFMKNMDALVSAGKEIPYSVDVSFTVNFKKPEFKNIEHED